MSRNMRLRIHSFDVLRSSVMRWDYSLRVIYLVCNHICQNSIMFFSTTQKKNMSDNGIWYLQYKATDYYFFQTGNWGYFLGYEFFPTLKLCMISSWAIACVRFFNIKNQNNDSRSTLLDFFPHGFPCTSFLAVFAAQEIFGNCPTPIP